MPTPQEKSIDISNPVKQISIKYQNDRANIKLINNEKERIAKEVFQKAAMCTTMENSQKKDQEDKSREKTRLNEEMKIGLEKAIIFLVVTYRAFENQMREIREKQEDLEKAKHSHDKEMKEFLDQIRKQEDARLLTENPPKNDQVNPDVKEKLDKLHSDIKTLNTQIGTKRLELETRRERHQSDVRERNLAWKKRHDDPLILMIDRYIEELKAIRYQTISERNSYVSTAPAAAPAPISSDKLKQELKEAMKLPDLIDQEKYLGAVLIDVMSNVENNPGTMYLVNQLGGEDSKKTDVHVKIATVSGEASKEADVHEDALVSGEASNESENTKIKVPIKKEEDIDKLKLQVLEQHFNRLNMNQQINMLGVLAGGATGPEILKLNKAQKTVDKFMKELDSGDVKPDAKSLNEILTSLKTMKKLESEIEGDEVKLGQLKSELKLLESNINKAGVQNKEGLKNDASSSPGFRK